MQPSYEDRYLHISRLPSSSLLGSKIDSQARRARLVRLFLRPEVPIETLTAKWWDAASDGFPAVTWDLLASATNRNVLYILAQQGGSSESEPHQSLEAKLARWTSAIRDCLSKPSASSQLVAITESEQYPSFTCLECVYIKPGLETDFSAFAREWLEPDLPQPPRLIRKLQSEVAEAVGHTLLQDVTNSTIFYIMYHFTSESAASKVRSTDAWRSWRRRFGPYVDGPCNAENLKVLLTNRENSDRSPVSTTATSSSFEMTPHEITTFSLDRSEEVANACMRTDERLKPYYDFIRSRFEAYVHKIDEVKGSNNSWLDVARAHEEFGVMRTEDESVYRVREWLPGAKCVYVFGDFNNWTKDSHPLCKETLPDSMEPSGAWSTSIPGMGERQRYKLRIIGADDVVRETTSLWIRVAWPSIDPNLLDGVVWTSRSTEVRPPRPSPPEIPKIYEVHIGICSEDLRIGTYTDCKSIILPRMEMLGMNTLLIKGLQEHPYFGSGGWHVSGFFAPSSRYGSLTELNDLVDTAHRAGIRVLLSLILTHASPSMDMLDGTESCGGLFATGPGRMNAMWDAPTFDYSQLMAQRFTLSTLTYYLEELNVDGFYFEGLHSLLYRDHALNEGFDRYDYHCHFSNNAAVSNQVFLMMVNEMIHTLRPDATTIAGDICQTPTLATPIHEGGLGFDYVASLHVNTAVTKLAETADDMRYPLRAFCHELDRLSTEKRVSVMENIDSLMVGKRRMKIAFFAWETLHTIAVGGIAPHVTELAAALRRCGHEVHVFTRATTMSAAVSCHYGVFYHEITFSLDRDFVQECANMCGAFVSAMLDEERSSAEAFDIVHGHDWLAARAVTALKGLGRTCVFTMHSTEVGRCGNQVFGGDSARIRAIEREACLVANRVICVSGVLAEEVRSQYSIHPEKIRVVYNGCNVQNFDGFEDAAPTKQRYGIEALQPTILFVGRFVVQKGVDLLVEAVPHIMRFRSDVVFVIVGDGHMRSDVEKRARQLGIAHALRFVGAKSGPELKSLFKMCDAVIVPSRNEPFGIVVLEAWSAYKPVIATTCGGPRDFVTPNTDGILVDPNPNSIAWGVCELLKNFEHARWMGERGRVKAAYNFSWDTIGLQTRSIYYELLNRSDAPYCVSLRGGCSLAQRTMGASLYHHMTIFDDDACTRRGLALLRILQLLTYTLASDAIVLPMGSEFGHPDWIDLPRAGNQFSHFHARRQWSLSLRKELKYKHSMLFTKALNALDSALEISTSQDLYVSCCNEDDRVLAFERGHCLIVANLHPDRSYTDYGIGHSLKSATSGALKCVLDIDQTRFGGWGRIADNFGIYPPCADKVGDRDQAVKLYLPARSAFVLVPEEIFEERQVATIEVLNDMSPDTLIDQFVSKHPNLANVNC